MDIEKYNQHRYKHLPLGYAEFSDNNWCAICSAAYSISRKYTIDLYPEVLNELLKQHNGFLKCSGSLIWARLEEVFPDLDVIPRIWSGKHQGLDSIDYFDIVSVDGERYKKGYQSHFVSIINPVLDERYDIIDYKIFDPYHADEFNLLNRYNKGNLKDSIFTIINL